MIVASIGIDGKLVFIGRDTTCRGVVQGYDDDAAGTFKEQGGVKTLVEIVGQIVHVSMSALFYPLAIVGGHLCINRSRLSYTTSRKAETEGLGFQLFT